MPAMMYVAPPLKPVTATASSTKPKRCGGGLGFLVHVKPPNMIEK
jgi:hypothetical protein